MNLNAPRPDDRLVECEGRERTTYVSWRNRGPVLLTCGLAAAWSVGASWALVPVMLLTTGFEIRREESTQGKRCGTLLEKKVSPRVSL
jgi:hypothetical protein